MILHLVTFRWKEDVSASDVEALCKELAEFIGGIEGVVEYRYGPDLGLRADNADFGIAALMTSEEALTGYLDAPSHKDLVARVIVPMAAHRTAVQISVDG